MKKITLPPELVGRLIGYVILLLIIVGLPYLATSFVQWQLDPSYWSLEARLWTIIGMFLLFAFHWSAANVSIGSSREERR